MILLYRILYLPGLLLALPYYLYRMWRRGGYGKGFGNRFGRMKQVPQKHPGRYRIWIQAVSVGELLAIAPVIRQLTEDSDLEIFLTTTTSTGYRLIEEKFTRDTAWQGIFPMDFWLFSRLAWKRIDPDMVVLMEGELWPEHIHQAYLRGVPTVLLNARLSDRSFRRHFRMKAVTRSYFRKLKGIYAGSESDLKRFRALNWLPPERIFHMGNLKLDFSMDATLGDDARASLLRELGFLKVPGTDAPPFILLGSSTWPGEEAALVDCYLQLRKEISTLRLLLVPRHAERKREIESALAPYPLSLHFRSNAKQAPSGCEVYVADTTGELRTLTQLADLVFIGKSLPPNTGGQTPVEAAALGKPLILGPDMSNFRDISRQLVKHGAARKVENTDTLAGIVRSLIQDPDARLQMGSRAAAIIEASRGATNRACEVIRNCCLSSR